MNIKGLNSRLRAEVPAVKNKGEGNVNDLIYTSYRKRKEDLINEITQNQLSITLGTLIRKKH
jgi:hypothetical protein